MFKRNRRVSQSGFTVLGATLTLALATAGAAGALVYNAGAIRVHVQENRPGGENINIVIPAAIVPLALAFAPDKHLQHVAVEIRAVLPILQAAAEALARTPDFTLVEVRERGEHVLVEKIGDTFRVRVDSDDEKVDVSFPISMVLSVANRLSRIQVDEDLESVLDRELGRELDLDLDLDLDIDLDIDLDELGEIGI